MADASARATTRFLWLYGLANAGAVTAYVPLLTLLLPARMASMAGDAQVGWLAAATFAGALTASLFNIAFGWASDLAGTRRAWVAAGLLLTLASYGLVALADSPGALVGAVVGYQAALNMMLAPLAAWAADAVPDERKGRLAGWLAIGQPVGALAGVVATLPFFRAPDARLVAVGAMAAALVLPLLLIAKPRAVRPEAAAAPPAKPALRRRDLALLWFARLLVQVAGSVLFAFLLYYFQSLPDARVDEADVARLVGATLVVAAPLALILGRASDRARARRPFLLGAAIAMSAGLALMAIGRGVAPAVAGYALFGCGTAVFLSFGSAWAMQLLPSPERRGRDLGVFNLANTLPALLSPLLAAGLVPAYGFRGLMAVLAGLVALAALAVAAMRERGQALEMRDATRHSQA